MQNRSRYLVTFVLISSLGFAGEQVFASETRKAADLGATALLPYVNMLNDLSERRRRIVYRPYPIDPYQGIQQGYVHVSSGVTSFSRVDLVVDANIPIVMRRAYSSAERDAREFGRSGWRLTISEKIESTSAKSLVYTYGNGAAIHLNMNGVPRHPERLSLTDISDIERSSDGEFIVSTRTGLTKRFKRIGNVHNLVEVIDEAGNGLILEYSSGGLLARIASSQGGEVSVGRDGIGRIVSILDNHGRTVAYTYDESGNLAGVTDMRGEEWRYRYSSKGLIEATTPGGSVDLKFSYDGAGRVSESSINGLTHKFDYKKRSTVVVESGQRTTTYRASGSGITTRILNALGVDSKIRLDKFERPVALIRNNAVVARVKYSRRDRSRVRSITSYYNNERENRTVVFDSMNRMTGMAVDSVSTIHVSGYWAGLVPRTVVTETDGSIAINFDGDGNISEFVRETGDSFSFIRREQELQVAELGSGKVATLFFDELGQLSLVKAPNGETLGYSMDSAGFRESTVINEGDELTYAYGPSGSLTQSVASETDKPKRVLDFHLSDSFQLLKLTDSEGPEHKFDYNEFGQIVSVASEAIGNLSFSYDELGRLVEAADDKGSFFSHSYRPGEIDIVKALDARTAPIFNQQFEVSSFPNRLYGSLGRVEPSYAGVIRYDSSVGEFSIPYLDRDWNPVTPIERTIDGLRFSSLFGDDGPDLSKFSMPSNRFFIPEEIWSANCCVCWGIPELDEIGNESVVEFCIGCGIPPWWFPEPEPEPPPPPGIITLTYSMFIPTNHVIVPLTPSTNNLYAGDDKLSHQLLQGTFRIQQHIIVNTNLGFVLPIRQSGVTKGWDDADANLVNGTCTYSDCSTCKYPPVSLYPNLSFIRQGKCRSNVEPVCSLLATDMSSMTAEVTGTTTTSMTIKFQGSPSNACEGAALGVSGLSFAADISWEHILTINWSGGTPTYSLVLKHDGFPSHQIDINTVPVYAYDPVTSQKSPWSLFPPKDIVVNKSGIVPTATTQ